MLAVPTLLLSASLATAAHLGCGGQPLGKRNVAGPGPLIPRQAAPTNEASAATSLDINYECTDYSYAPIVNVVKDYPPTWTIATIVANDTEATELFASINASVNAALPNDLPHGTPTGNFSGVSYNASDPDCWWSWSKCTTPAASTGLKADLIKVPEPMTWGLGFDDGPNCSHNAFYDFLKENDQLATLFYIGSNVLDWPLQALRSVQDGHQVCVHTWSHRYMTALSNEEVFAEFYYTRKLIKYLLGVTPMCWRPPYGDVDNRVRYIASQLNLSTVVWTDDTNDWREGADDGVTPADVTMNYQAVINKTSNGTYVNYGPIVLTHELTNFTMSEFMSMYSSIKAAFKHIVPIATAYNETHPYAETNITFPDFATYISTRSNSSSGSANGTTPSASSSSGSSGAASAGAAAAATTSKTSAATTTIALSSALFFGGLVVTLL